MRASWFGVLQVLVVSGGLLAAQGQSQADPNITKNFKVKWSSIRYDKAVVLENPEVATTAGQNSETLLLSCRVEVSDPNLVLGISQGGVASQFTDRRGRDIAAKVIPMAESRQAYDRLGYQPKMKTPPPVPRWREFIQRVLLRRAASFGPLSPPPVVMRLQPSQITMQLDMESLGLANGEFRSVKGHFYALVAGSFEYVDVPFEPNNTWVRLTPETQIHMAEATQTGSSFQYNIDMLTQGDRLTGSVAQGGMPAGSLAQRIRPRRPVTVGDSLPARMIVAQQFIGEDGRFLGASGVRGPLMVPTGGRGTSIGADGRVKAIRFVIAVDPKEYKIPFEVGRVPLPKP